VLSDSSRIRATASVLKEIITILLALAFTTAIVTFLTEDGFSPVRLQTLSLEAILVFFCILPTIVRFYHGNVNYINKTYSVSDAEAKERRYAVKLSIDFSVFLTQAMIFSALALFQDSIIEFFALFVALFTLDACWCFVNFWLAGYVFRSSESSRQNKFMVSQSAWGILSACAALLIFTLLVVTPDNEKILSGAAFMVVTIVGVLDYGLNRKFYFMFTRKRVEKAFVAARFTSAVQDGQFDPLLKQLIQEAIELLRSSEIEPLGSHEAERFGELTASPADLVMRNFNDIEDADIFIGIWDREISPGMLIEIGWASAHSKPIILLLPHDYNLEENPMIEGMKSETFQAGICKCKVCRYESVVDFRVELRTSLRDMCR